MKIKSKFQIITVLSIAIGLMIAFTLFIHIQNMRATIEDNDKANQLTRSVFELNLLTNDYLFNRTERTRMQWQLRNDSLTELIQSMKFRIKEEKLLKEEILNNHDQLKVVFSRIIANYAIRKNSSEMPAELSELEELLVRKLLTNSQIMVSNVAQLIGISHRELVSTQRKSSLVVIFFVILITVIIAANSFFTRKSILVPILKLQKGTQTIGEGDLNFKITSVSKDEIGDLSRAFDHMTENLKTITVSRDKLEREISVRKQTEEMLREKTHDLGERVKELNCLYGISHLVEIHAISLVGIIQGITDLILPSWEYPEITCSRIILEGKEYKTENFRETEWKQSSGIFVHGEQVGTLEVYYLEEKPEIDEGPFLKEERNLINSITERLGHIIERIRSEEEKTKLQNQLQQTQKMEAIGTLAGGIAHQFNNALSIITISIDLLKEDLPDNELIDNYTQQMKESTDRMTQLTAQLLAYGKGGKYQAKTISINEFVKNTLPVIQSSIDSAIRVETNLSSDILNVKADQTQMQMVLSAILTNASEAIEGKGFIRITTGEEDINTEFAKHHPGLKIGPYICLTVEDNGKGMDKETISRIFEPFFTTKFEGRGLGMASAFGIVKNHDGWISVYSEEGRGTVVRIYLPLIKTQVKVAKKSKIEPMKGTGTILLIEDEKMLMKASRALLEILGYNVLGAMTGKEAVNIVKTFDGEIDLAILDMVLPDMGGKAIYPLIMEARPNLKVLVCSGYSIDGPAQEVLDAGAQDFIQKPFATATLSEKMKQVLGGT